MSRAWVEERCLAWLFGLAVLSLSLALTRPRVIAGIVLLGGYSLWKNTYAVPVYVGPRRAYRVRAVCHEVTAS